MAKLYIVPTPIGNLDDITLRAVNVLRDVDFILAEDTRTTSFLLKHLGIEKKLYSHHKFNEHATVKMVAESIAAGRNAALVSDAGTPGISDPGFLLVRTCVEAGIEVETLPGATALIPALVTRTPRIGYVREAFYNYYRRANTISTSFVGGMVDILQAFRSFMETSDPKYREEVVYCIAKQLYWNMTQSRVLFQADFIEFLKEYKRYFLLNSYLAKDRTVQRLLDFLDKEVIPERFICVHFGRPIPEGYLEELRKTYETFIKR